MNAWHCEESSDSRFYECPRKSVQGLTALRTGSTSPGHGPAALVCPPLVQQSPPHTVAARPSGRLRPTPVPGRGHSPDRCCAGRRPGPITAPTARPPALCGTASSTVSAQLPALCGAASSTVVQLPGLCGAAISLLSLLRRL